MRRGRGALIDLGALAAVVVALVATGVSIEELGARAILAVALVAVLAAAWLGVRGTAALFGPPPPAPATDDERRARHLLGGLSRVDGPCRIAVLGAMPGAGTSTVAAAIAGALSEAGGREVALIDVSALGRSRHNAAAMRALRNAEAGWERFVIDVGSTADAQDLAALMVADRLVVVAAGDEGPQIAQAMLDDLAGNGLDELARRAVVVENLAPQREYRSQDRPEPATHPVVSVASDARLRRRGRFDRVGASTRHDVLQLATVLIEAGPRSGPAPGPRPDRAGKRSGRFRRSTAG